MTHGSVRRAVFPLNGGRSAFFDGDVMGHGPTAAKIAERVREPMRPLMATGDNSEVVLERLGVVFNEVAPDQFMTMVYGVVDPLEGKVTMANAGHPP